MGAPCHGLARLGVPVHPVSVGELARHSGVAELKGARLSSLRHEPANGVLVGFFDRLEAEVLINLEALFAGMS